MTDIAFSGIANAIKARLLYGLAGMHNNVRVVVEREFEPVDSWISINFQGVQTSDGQPLTAASKQLLTVQFSIWCWRFNFDKNAAIKARNDLVGDCELALMLDRSLDGSVITSWLEGGRFNRNEDPQNLGRFFFGGEILLSCDIYATNI